MDKAKLSQLQELPGKWRERKIGLPEAMRLTPGGLLNDCANELEPLLASLLAERKTLRLLLFECARELSYVQCIENCNSGLCATSLGADLVERSIKALGIPDLRGA